MYCFLQQTCTKLLISKRKVVDSNLEASSSRRSLLSLLTRTTLQWQRETINVKTGTLMFTVRKSHHKMNAVNVYKTLTAGPIAPVAPLFPSGPGGP